MARNSEEESCKGSEEDEALSLSDLPLNFINEETSLLQSSKEAIPQVMKENEEEFNFDSRGGSLSAESEMYAADEVFFKGQMLPVRLSVSSDSGLLARFEKDGRNNNSSSILSRSESLDRGIRNTTTNSRPKIRNQFHSFPSPKPQIRVSNARLLGNGIIGSRSQKATVWDIFRQGLVRAPPEIELHNINSSVSRNSSSGSSSSCSAIVVKNKQDLKLEKQQQKKESFLDKRKGLFSGCRCSIAAVETVPLNNIDIIKSNNGHESSSSSSRNNNNKNKESNSRGQDMEKKLQELKIKKKNREKQAMSRHRTFEWLKELSHADGNLLV